MSAKTLIRDSAILLLIGTGVALSLRGLGWAVPFLLAGLVAVANLYLIALLTRNLIRPEGQQSEVGGARMALGMLIKFAGTGGALLALVSNFDIAPVLFGFGVVVVAITARGILDLFLPAETQEA